MVRTQIQLTKQQVKAVKSRAAEEGRSMADVIRSSVGAYLKSDRESRQAKYRRALKAIGRFDSGKTDLGVNHDRYLAEAYRK